MRRSLAALAVLVSVVSARADDTPRASAVELFTRGRALAAEDRCGEAVPFFLDTLRLEPSVGALLNLAECHEKLGEPSLAFMRYREAEALARQKHDDRETLARTRWGALASRVPKVLVIAPPNTRVTVDGEAISASPEAVASGEHVVVASSPGKRPWHATVRTEGTDTQTVTVPELASAARLPDAPRGAVQRAVGVIVTAVGTAGIGVGAILGAAAIAKKNDASSLSTGPSETDFDAARASAKTLADASTVTFVAAGIVAAAGLTLWLAAPRARVVVVPTSNAIVATFIARF